jgi:hypothetical protein
MKIDNVTKYGRSFSVVRVPYALKLMMQELQCMNIQMRIITEDNIDQLSSMINSNNLVNLLGENITAAKVATNTRAVLNKSQRNINTNVGPPIEILPVTAPPVPPIEDKTQSPVIDPEDIGWKFLEIGEYGAWGALIIKADGKESDIWDNESNDFNDPTDTPAGWISSEAIYDDGLPIPTTILSQQLKLIQEPNNWKRAIAAARALKGKSVMSTPPMSEQFVKPGSPLYMPASTLFNESTQYGENSPDYQPDDDSPKFRISTPDKDTQGIKLNIQENISSVNDTIQDINDVGKKSILDIDKATIDELDKNDSDNKSENSKSIRETKIISTNMVD